MIRVLLFLLTTSVLLGAESRLQHVYKFVFPAYVHPEEYAGKVTGHFGRKFVASPKTRSYAIPDTPKRIRGRPEPGVIQAALLIDKYGDTKDVAVIAATPNDIVDDAVLKYLKQRIRFVVEKEGKRAIEYETEIVLVFSPASEKKG